MAGSPAHHTAASPLSGCGTFAWQGVAAPDLRTFTSAGRGAIAPFGEPWERWTGDPGFWAARLHPQDRDRVLTTFRDAARDRTAVQIDYRMVGDKGRERWVHDSAHCEPGEPARWTGVMIDITPLYEADRKSRASQSAHERLFEATSDVIYTLDLEGRFTSVNRRYEELSGYTAAELIGRSCFDLLDPKSVERARQMFQEKISGAVPETRFEVTEIGKSGRRFSLEIISRTILEDGRPVGVQGVARDLNETRRAAEALRRSEARREEVQRIARLGTWEFVFGTREIIASPEIARICGVPDDVPLTWRVWRSRVHRDDLPRLDAAIESTRLHGTRFDMEYRLIVDGEERIVHALGELADADADARATRMWGSLQDVTERHRAEQELQRLRSAVDQIDEAIMVTDRDGIITYTNAALQRLSGHSAAVLLGNTPRLLRSGQMSQSFFADLWKTVLSGRVWRGVVINRHASGRLYTEEQTITPVRDDRGQIKSFIAIGKDITARRALEEQVRQAGKMEAVGRLASGVAHDFSNLLTIISGYGDVLMAGIGEGDRLRRAAVAIKKASDRASALAQQLLTFSRRQPVAPRPLDLNELVGGMGNLLRRLIGEHIELVTSLSEPLGRVEADTGQLEQVLMNLAANARDAMPNGGVLTIETLNVTLEKDQTRVAPGEYVCLKVSDTGCGMDAETLSHLFEPFFTTKPPGKGTGIGLSIVYGIVEQSGGCTVVNSEVGVGSTLAVYLPKVERPWEELIGDGGDTAMPRGTETVLLVEDEDAVRGLLREHLEGCGYSVLEARGGAEALAIMGWHTEKIHLLATDVIMPQMSGRQLADKLRAQRPDLKVLFVSGYSDLESQSKDGLGADAVLLRKPFTGGDFARKVREVLDGVPAR